MHLKFTHLILLVILLVDNIPQGDAQSSGDYRSIKTGNWNSTSTWQTYSGGNWGAAASTPTSANGIITIQNGDTVKVSANVTVDQVVISAGGTVFINDNFTLTINNGTGTDLDIYGTLQEIGTGSTGASISNASGSIVFESTGVYQHNFSSSTTQGAIPIATWNDGSTCEMIGFTSNGASLHAANLNQSFSSFVWNCPNETSAYGMQGLLQTVRGNFTMENSGSPAQIVYGLGASSGGLTMTIGDSMIISGGIFDFANSGASGTFVLNIGGAYYQTGGTFQNDYASGMDVHFTGAAGAFKQSAGTFTSTNMNLFVDNGALFTLNSNIPVSTAFTVSSGGSFISGSYIVSGAGKFTLSSGGTLDIGSASGITSSGAAGSIQVTAARSFNTGGDYTYNGSAAQVTGNGLPATVNNLTISNLTGVSLSATVSVNNILALSAGLLTTNAFQVNVTNTAIAAITSYSSSNYVVGNLDRSVSATGSYDFPVGTSAYYELINTNLSAVTGFTNILANFTNANPINALYPLTGLTVNTTPITGMLDYGYWTLSPNTSMTGGTYSVTVNEQGQSNSATTAAAYTVLQRTNTNSYWSTNGTHINSTQSVSGGVVTAVRSALTSISQYGIGYGAGALPIELLYFKALFNVNHVDLNWATATEINNNYFTVERSQDGKTFEEILKKSGAGTSTKTLYYSAADEEPMKGISYYRLKQTDYDGKYTYSPVIVIKYKMADAGGNISIQAIGPNPFAHSFIINYDVAAAGAAVEVQVINGFGQLVYKEITNADKGFNTYSFKDLQGLAPGIYIVNMICNGETVTQKLIKQ